MQKIYKGEDISTCIQFCLKNRNLRPSAIYFQTLSLQMSQKHSCTERNNKCLFAYSINNHQSIFGTVKINILRNSLLFLFLYQWILDQSSIYANVISDHNKEKEELSKFPGSHMVIKVVVSYLTSPQIFCLIRKIGASWREVCFPWTFSEFFPDCLPTFSCIKASFQTVSSVI